jgi:hypothetical protein
MRVRSDASTSSAVESASRTTPELSSPSNHDRTALDSA